MTKPKPTFEVKIPKAEQRLRELVLYISDRCDSDPNFGKTKLNKVLVFADFTSFARTGKPITGVQYMREKNGPMPRPILGLLDRMVSKGEIVIRPVQVGPYVQRRVIPLRKADLSLFTSEEIAEIEASIRHCWDHTATSISDLTHGVAWKIAEVNGAGIPYEAAFLSDEPIRPIDIERTRALNTLHNWEA
jgi:hypothetical protein